MRLSAPRVPPVSLEEYRTLHESLFGTAVPEGARVLNVTRTWARHPALMKAQRPYQQHLVTHSTLPRRDHELAVLRIGWLCQSAYEFGQHTVFGRQAGLTDADITRVTEGPDAAGWTPHEAAVVRAVDQLYNDAFITDATWAELSASYTVPQLIDFIVLVGRYWTVSVVLNTLGVQLEDGTPGFPR